MRQLYLNGVTGHDGFSIMDVYTRASHGFTKHVQGKTRHDPSQLRETAQQSWLPHHHVSDVLPRLASALRRRRQSRCHHQGSKDQLWVGGEVCGAP